MSTSSEDSDDNFLRLHAKAIAEALQQQEASQGFGERPAEMEQFFRSGKAGGWQSELTPDQISRIANAFERTIQKHYGDYVPVIRKLVGKA